MTNSEFVVTEHHAKRAGLHWDLRFKMPKSNMWASFAVRKGVPLNPGTKVLAVRTHDHKKDEALLKGELKDGYGAGKFIEWDRGKCVIHKYSVGHMAIEFKGKKVKGLYHLVNIGVKDKNFEGLQYWLFKGKAVKEIMGMASRVPSRGLSTDTEVGPSYDVGEPLHWSLAENYPDTMGSGMGCRLPPSDTSEVESSDEEEDKVTHKKLPWSLAEGVKVMKDYALIAQYKPMKGFFTKKVAGEYLVVGIKDSKNDTFILFQFFDRLKDDMYIVGMVGSAQSPDDDVLEGELDQLRYNNDVTVLEDKLPIKVSFGNKIQVKFTKASKYLGNSMDLFHDSRLPEGYMIAKAKMKKGFEPAQQFKIGKDSMDMNTMKKMRAFTSSRLKTIMKQKK